jgi:hypothetical protein
MRSVKMGGFVTGKGSLSGVFDPSPYNAGLTIFDAYLDPCPSSILITVPVTHSDAGDTKYSKVLSIWAGWQIRLRGKFWLISPILDNMPSIISLAKAPGAIQLTLMGYRDHSTAWASVILTTALLVVA